MNSLASRYAVGLASFFIFYYLLFLLPNIVVYMLVEPIVTYFPLYIRSYPPISYSSPFSLNKIEIYIPSRSMTVMVSSIRPILSYSSYLVLALMLGPPFT